MTPLERFALAVLKESRHDGGGDVEGGWLQDKAEELGLLVKVRVTEPCGENCWCASFDDFPQDCLRESDAVRAAMNEP